jgi:hypothetical protein
VSCQNEFPKDFQQAPEAISEKSKYLRFPEIKRPPVFGHDNFIGW